MKRDKVYRMLMIGLIILFIVVSFMGVCVGRYSMNPLDVIRSVADRITGAEPRDPNMDIIFFNIRVPRVLAAILIGSALSISGAVYQSVFKNPLVSPDILGVSNGACVGAALAIILGAGILFQQVLAFVGGIIAVLINNIVSDWMDICSIYICPVGALLAAVMFFWVCGKDFAAAEIEKGGRPGSGKLYAFLGKYVFCFLSVLVLILGSLTKGGIG